MGANRSALPSALFWTSPPLPDRSRAREVGQPAGDSSLERFRCPPLRARDCRGKSVRAWRTIVANLSGLREFPSCGLKNEPKRHIFPGSSATAQRRPARSAWFQRMIWRLNRAMDCSRRRRPVVCQVAPPAKVRACRFAMAQGSPWIWSRLPLATARQPFWQEPSPAFQSGLQKERDLTGRPHRRPTPL